MYADDLGLLRVAVDTSDADRALIRLLQEDGRASYARLARSLGITEKTARRRVDELLRSGVIQITTVTDPEVLAYRAMACPRSECWRAAPSRRWRPSSQSSSRSITSSSPPGVTTLSASWSAATRSNLFTTLEQSVRSLPGIAELEVLPYLRLHYQEPCWEATR